MHPHSPIINSSNTLGGGVNGFLCKVIRTSCSLWMSEILRSKLVATSRSSFFREMNPLYDLEIATTFIDCILFSSLSFRSRSVLLRKSSRLSFLTASSLNIRHPDRLQAWLVQPSTRESQKIGNARVFLAETKEPLHCSRTSL
jgi:hypothetical protein